MLQVPALLDELVATGRWPHDADAQLAQNLGPLVSPERVRRLAPDQDRIYLCVPPFVPIGRRSDPKDFFNWPSSDPSGIDYDQAIMIGDFGIGSDSPIVLDYREDAANPRVVHLRYEPNAPPLVGKWVVLTPDFLSFVEALGL